MPQSPSARARVQRAELSGRPRARACERLGTLIGEQFGGHRDKLLLQVGAEGDEQAQPRLPRPVDCVELTMSGSMSSIPRPIASFRAIRGSLRGAGCRSETELGTKSVAGSILRNVRRLVIGASIAAVAVVGVAAVSLGATRTIKVGDNYFVRSSGVPGVTVKRGTVVRWRWVGGRPHNVRVSRGPVRFRSRTQRSGTYRKRIFTTGRYVIICSIHGGRDQKMVLRVTR